MTAAVTLKIDMHAAILKEIDADRRALYQHKTKALGKILNEKLADFKDLTIDTIDFKSKKSFKHLIVTAVVDKRPFYFLTAVKWKIKTGKVNSKDNEGFSFYDGQNFLEYCLQAVKVHNVEKTTTKESETALQLQDPATGHRIVAIQEYVLMLLTPKENIAEELTDMEFVKPKDIALANFGRAQFPNIQLWHSTFKACDYVNPNANYKLQYALLVAELWIQLAEKNAKIKWVDLTASKGKDDDSFIVDEKAPVRRVYVLDSTELHSKAQQCLAVANYWFAAFTIIGLAKK